MAAGLRSPSFSGLRFFFSTRGIHFSKESIILTRVVSIIIEYFRTDILCMWTDILLSLITLFSIFDSMSYHLDILAATESHTRDSAYD